MGGEREGGGVLLSRLLLNVKLHNIFQKISNSVKHYVL